MSEPTEPGQAVIKASGVGKVHRTVWREYSGRPYLVTFCALGIDTKVVVDPREIPQHLACRVCWREELPK